STGHGLLQRSQHERQWRAEFVTDVAEEGCFGSVQFCKCLGPFPLLFMGTGIGDSGCNLDCNEFDEAPVQVVELQSGTHPSDEEASRLVRSVGRNRRHDGGVRWVRPGTGWYGGKA